MFHHTRDATEAQLTIVLAALAIATFIQNQTGLSLKKIVSTLRPVHSALLQIDDHRQLGGFVGRVG